LVSFAHHDPAAGFNIGCPKGGKFGGKNFFEALEGGDGECFDGCVILRDSGRR
jgi:hypothetical protein